MGLKVERSGAFVIARERLYLTRDRNRVVGEGDASAGFLLAGVGDQITFAEAEQYGLLATSQPAAPEVKPVEPEKGEPETVSSETKPVEPKKGKTKGK